MEKNGDGQCVSEAILVVNNFYKQSISIIENKIYGMLIKHDGISVYTEEIACWIDDNIWFSSVLLMLLILSMLGENFSRQNFEIVFLFFSRK